MAIASTKLGRIVMTAQNRQEWLEWRRGGIGGSDAPAVAGVDPRKGPLAIYLDKAGLLPLDTGDEDEAQRWGRLLETAIADEFEVQRGLDVMGRQLRVEHRTIPWMRSTVDGFVFENSEEGVDITEALGVLEIKTASRRTGDWKDDDGRSKLPEHVAIQVQHQLAVTGLNVAFVAVLMLFPVPHMEIFEVERDQDDIEALIELEQDFWQRVQDRRPPAADAFEQTGDALRVAFAKPKGGAIELSDEAMELVRMRQDGHKAERAGKDRKEAAVNGLMALMGNAEVANRNGKVVFTWTAGSRKDVDLDGLRAKHPKLVARFTKEVPSRRFNFRTRSIVDVEEESA